MSTILKGYVLRLYPTDIQKEMINKTIGCTRFIYNHFLNKKISGECSALHTFYTPKEQLNELAILYKEFPWLEEVDTNSFKTVIYNLDNAYKRYKNGQNSHPKPKNKDKGIGYKTSNVKIDFTKRTVTLPKLKEIKFRGYKNKTHLTGTIRNAVIKKEANKYYISILVEEPFISKKFTPKSIVGIDLGIKNIITTSYNEKIENSLSSLNVKRRIKGLQKALSRCKPGSKNRYKVKLKIKRAFMKLKNIRKQLIHDITNKLIKENDIIAMESLNIKSMYQTHKTSVSLSNIPLSEIKRVLEYKCKWQNKKLITIDRFYPSSQICSVCGYQNKQLKNISIREWICPKCGNIHDRDLNASVNIMFEGLKKHMQTLINTDIKTK